MSDIELIVKIPEIEYEHLTNQEKFNSLRKSKQEWLIEKTLNRVADATQLPKGHKRLIEDNFEVGPIFDKDGNRVGYKYVTEEDLSKALTIVEADKEN